MSNLCLEAGEGRTFVSLHCCNTGRGVSVCMTGGESPHVGGVVLCTPRASLSDGSPSCDEYVLPVSGHKDHEAARVVANRLCRVLGVPVSVSCGIHSEHMTADEICLVLAHVAELADKLAEVCVAQEKPAK